ncbi:hypothetical protein EVAR_286_1 [Eumeta japonica]|uniref:Uncharacterized protein n=1 Tax=Eumeta variegata TaxID=151549 RepID=A0A4C1SBR0_EUMVA|nr:hypothetical protein EVAR_286_1 [Eumeta japonica]
MQVLYFERRERRRNVTAKQWPGQVGIRSFVASSSKNFLQSQLSTFDIVHRTSIVLPEPASEKNELEPRNSLLARKRIARSGVSVVWRWPARGRRRVSRLAHYSSAARWTPTW